MIFNTPYILNTFLFFVFKSFSVKDVNNNQKANQSFFFEMNKWHDYREILKEFI